MSIRDLKYYSWSYKNGKETLFDKRKKIELPLSMNMGDSFCRAHISFRNQYRIEQIKKIREMYRNKIKALQERLHKAKVTKKN